MMSDDLLRELEQDLQREKQKVFFQKYKFHVLSIVSLVLVCVGVYQLSNYSKEKKIIEAANNYRLLTESYTDIEKLTDHKTPHPALTKQTIQNVSEYAPMATLTELNALNISDASERKKLKLLENYIQSSTNKNQTINDSILWTHYLSLSSGQDTLEQFEKKLSTYLSHTYAFKMVGYEFAFLIALKEKNETKAIEYLKLLENSSDERTKTKILLYKTHPLIVNYSEKDNVKKDNLTKNQPKISNNHDKTS